MTTDPWLLLLVSCRHCLRPVTLAAGTTDLELAELEEHLRKCMRDPSRDVLDHFRIVGDRALARRPTEKDRSQTR